MNYHLVSVNMYYYLVPEDVMKSLPNIDRNLNFGSTSVEVKSVVIADNALTEVKTAVNEAQSPPYPVDKYFNWEARSVVRYSKDFILDLQHHLQGTAIANTAAHTSPTYKLMTPTPMPGTPIPSSTALGVKAKLVGGKLVLEDAQGNISTNAPKAPPKNPTMFISWDGEQFVASAQKQNDGDMFVEGYISDGHFNCKYGTFAI